MNIFSACNMNYLIGVQNLVNAKTNINVRHPTTGLTPLHIAVLNKNIQIIKLLVDHGANVNAKSRDNDTPLHCAFTSYDERTVEIVSYLTSHHADVNIIDTNQQTPLHRATLATNLPTKIMELLIAAGADANARAEDGYTPLHCVWYEIDWKKKIEILLAAGADIDAQTDNGDTPLFRHVRGNKIDAVRVFLEHNPTLEIRNKDGQTVLDETNDEAMRSLLQEYIASRDVKNAGNRK